MIQLTIDMPEGALAAVHHDPQEFTRALRLAAAVKWYEMRRISQGCAAEIAGLSRSEFLTALGLFGVSPFQEEAAEILRPRRVPDRWVVNASPVITLAKAGHLALLTALATEVLLPEAVVAEVLAGPVTDPARQAIEGGWGTRVTVPQVPVAVLNGALGAGEPRSWQSPWPTATARPSCDDAASRRCARTLGVPSHGHPAASCSRARSTGHCLGDRRPSRPYGQQASTWTTGWSRTSYGRASERSRPPKARLAAPWMRGPGGASGREARRERQIPPDLVVKIQAIRLWLRLFGRIPPACG